MSLKVPQAISLFAGAGGCSLGLRRAGFQVQLAADIDEAACKTYAANLPDAHVWNVDLSQVTATEIVAHSAVRATDIGLVVGGPPCQGFSSAGSKDWADPRNKLLRKFVEIVTELQPTWFVMENVEGLLTANDGYYLVEAVARLLEAGYWVRAKKVYMEQYGLPQRRKRVLVVGNLEQNAFDFPPYTHFEYPQLSLFEHQPLLSILDAITDLPEVASNGTMQYYSPATNSYQSSLRRTDSGPVSHHEPKKVNELTQARIALLAQGDTMKSLPEHLQHPSYTRRAFRRVMDGTPTEKRGGAPSGLKRLVATDPALTITSAAPTEFVHPVENRLLTLRECARIQSFPDWFEFYGSWSSVATQIGNAIPPYFMEKLAGHIREVATWKRVLGSRGRWLGIDATKSTGISPALSRMLAILEDKVYAYS